MRIEDITEKVLEKLKNRFGEVRGHHIYNINVCNNRIHVIYSFGGMIYSEDMS